MLNVIGNKAISKPLDVQNIFFCFILKKEKLVEEKQLTLTLDHRVVLAVLGSLLVAK